MSNTRTFDPSSLSLDIDSYTLNDILKLFSLSNMSVTDIKQNDMKSARKIVMMIHPDKSGLPKEYFQFFVKAYERLSDTVDYANRSTQCPSSYMEKQRKMNVELENDKGFGNALMKAGVITKNNTVGKDWGKWKNEFDKWFEKHGELSADTDGYDEFMKSTADLLPEGATEAQVRQFMEQRKSTLGALVTIESLSGVDSWNTFGRNNISGGGGEDLRRAYTETVVPVTDDDFKNIPKYNSVDEYKRIRHNTTQNLDYETSNKEYLRQKQSQEQKELAQYFEQMRIAERGKEDLKRFRSNILQLSN
jgi:curved DNA-binding protein CbpA